jgi:hypothetical protein
MMPLMQTRKESAIGSIKETRILVSNVQEKLHSGRTAAMENEKNRSELNICNSSDGHSMFMSLTDVKF